MNRSDKIGVSIACPFCKAILAKNFIGIRSHLKNKHVSAGDIKAMDLGYISKKIVQGRYEKTV